MKDLQILLLGPPEFRLNNQTIEIQRRTLRALLFYLASQSGKVGREEILLLFWEAESDYYARRRLSDTLSRLRAALPDPDALLVENDLVGLNYQRVYVDQIEFLELVDRAGRIPWQIPPSEPLPSQAHEYLLRAANLWRSPHYLAGASLPSSPALDEWLTRTTQRMELLLGRLLERLAWHARTIGDLEGSLELIRKALVLDDLNEDNQYLALQLLVELGHTSEAREHFNRLEELYQQEYDSSPPPQLVQLFRQVRQTPPPGLRVEIPVEWKVHPTMQAPFVGRRKIMDELQRLFVKGGGAFIFGESGQGKTRLMQEFTSKLAAPVSILATICRPAESNLPFQPIIELLRSQVAPTVWQELPAIWASQLLLLLPELASLRSGLERPLYDTAPEIAPGQARAQILEAIRQVFLVLSKGQRLLLCLDDAHWADEATLATVAYLLERPPFDHQAFFLAAARQEEDYPHLRALVASMNQSYRGVVIPLLSLNSHEIAELAQHVMGYTPSDRLTSLLSNETGGNPFILLESLRALMEKGSPAEIEYETRLPLAQSVQRLIASRLEKLSNLAQETLDAAAVIGNDITPDTISKVSGETPQRVATALAELEKRLLIELIDPAPERFRYRFAHEKIKETVLDGISPPQLRWLHRSTAQVTEAGHPTPDQAAILAQHYELAGELSLSFNYWVRAGQRARQLFSIASAQEIFAHAEGLIPRTADLSDEQIRDLFSEWTDISFMVEDIQTIQRINAGLLKLGQERNSPLLIGSALAGLSDASLASNQFEDGLNYTDQAIPYLEQTDNIPSRMQAQLRRGVFLYMLVRVEDSIQAFEQALSIGSDSPDLQISAARANVHYQIAVAHILGGWPETAQIHAQRSLADFTALNSTQGQMTAYSALAISLYFLGNYAQARLNSQLGIELASRSSAWRMLGYLHSYRGMIELASGNIDEAVLHAKRAVELGERYQHHEIASAGHRILGDVYFWLKDPSASLECYQLATQASHDQFLWIDSHLRLGLAFFQCGQKEAGQRLVEESIAFAENKGLGIELTQAWLSQMFIYRSVNDQESLDLLSRQIYQEALKRSIPTARLVATHSLGELAINAGEFPMAMEYFRGTARVSASLPHPWLEIESLTLLHNALNATGRPEPSLLHRIEILLDQLEETVHDQPFVRAFQEYRKKVSRSLT